MLKVLAEVQNKTSKKGNAYSVLHLKFESGYEMEVFLSNEQKYILSLPKS